MKRNLGLLKHFPFARRPETELCRWKGRRRRKKKGLFPGADRLRPRLLRGAPSRPAPAAHGGSAPKRHPLLQMVLWLSPTSNEPPPRGAWPGPPGKVGGAQVSSKFCQHGTTELLCHLVNHGHALSTGCGSQALPGGGGKRGGGFAVPRPWGGGWSVIL